MIAEPTLIRPDRDFDAIAERLRRDGWVLLTDGLDPGLALDLLADLHRQPQADWRAAGIGRRDDHHGNDLIRRDSTRWLDGATAAQRRFLADAETLRLELNRRLLLGLFDHECHYARYEPGAFYRKHRDAFRGRSNRVLTTVSYLNPDWTDANGGKLVLYGDDDVEITRILPRLGGLLIFLSEDFPHEVLPADRARFSIAGWFRCNTSTAHTPDPPR